MEKPVEAQPEKAGYGMTLDAPDAISLRLVGRLEGGDRLDKLLLTCRELIDAKKPLNRTNFLAAVRTEAKGKVKDGIAQAEAAIAAAQRRKANLLLIRGL